MGEIVVEVMGATAEVRGRDMVSQTPCPWWIVQGALGCSRPPGWHDWGGSGKLTRAVSLNTLAREYVTRGLTQTHENLGEAPGVMHLLRQEWRSCSSPRRLLAGLCVYVPAFHLLWVSLNYLCLLGASACLLEGSVECSRIGGWHLAE